VLERLRQQFDEAVAQKKMHLERRLTTRQNSVVS